MANISNDSQYKLVSGTADNDYIKNTGTYASVYGYSGSDTVYNTDNWSFIDAGAGNDSIYSYQGSWLTIRGGTGDDTITFKSLYSNNHVIQYYSGDGNDYIEDTWGSPNCTLQIGDGTGTYSTYMSGSDKIVTVGDGKITLAGAMSSINIAGKFAGIGTEETDSIGGLYLYNSTPNTLIIGTINGDSIWNGAGVDYVTIKTYTGNDTIYAWGSYNVIDAGAGNDFIYRFPNNATVHPGTGNDTVSLYGGAASSGDVITYTNGDGNDIVYNIRTKDTLSISGGTYSTQQSGSDIIVSVGTGKITLSGAATLSSVNIVGTYLSGSSGNYITNSTDYSSETGTNDDDTIHMSGAGGVNVYAYAGNDSIYSEYRATIDGGAGNDTIVTGAGSLFGGEGNDIISLTGGYTTTTVRGGTGNDTIYAGLGGSVYGRIFQYSNGDGFDVIDGFAYRDTLEILSGTYSTQQSGSDIIVTVGTGEITLSGAATLSSVNIAGTKSSTPSAETNSWKLSGTTATYGTSSKTLATVKGVKSTSGLTVSGKVVTVSKAALNASKVTLSGSGYTLALASDVAATSTKKTWSLNKTTATYKQTTKAGYKLASDAKSISYTKAATKTLATVKGVKSTDGLTVSGKVVTVSKAALGTSKVTVSDDYTLKLADNVAAASTKKAWSLNKTTATYKQTTKAGYKLASDAKSISYTKAATKTLATVKGVKSTDGLTVSGKVVTVSKAALGTSKVTVSDDYTLKLADNVAAASTKKAWSLNKTTATYKQTTKAGYKLASDAKSISYTKAATKTLATVSGAKSTKGFTLSGKTIKLATTSLSKKVSVSGSYSFEFASTYKSAKITGSASADTITTAGEKITINGGTSNDYILNKGKTSTINAGAGNDTIVNSGANVTIRGGKGNDSLTGSTGKDIYVYAQGDGNDVINNYDEADRISIESGAVKVSTSGDNVVFTVGTGKITLKKAKGKTITYYDASGKKSFYPEKTIDVEYNDAGTGATLKASYSKDSFEPSDYSTYKDILVTIDASAVTNELSITGNQKANRIIGSEEDDTIKGGKSKDTILGGDGNDKIYGEAGNDLLLGGAGSDSLWGGAGDDILTGGDGSDVFFYESGNDTITDFDSSFDSFDKIYVNATNIGLPKVKDRDVIFTVDDGRIIVKNGADKFIQLYSEKGVELDRKYNPYNS